LLLDEEHKRKMKDDEVNMKEIQRLQQMASTLNNALSVCINYFNFLYIIYIYIIDYILNTYFTYSIIKKRVTLLCDEIKRDSTSAGIENLNVQVQNTRNLPLDDVNLLLYL